MSISITQRPTHRVSSTATRIYQLVEWALILSIYCCKQDSEAFFSKSLVFSSFLNRWSAQRSWSWQVLQICTILITATTYEARSRWMSLFLYVVIFPVSVAYIKCSSVLHPSLSGTMFDANVAISVVSYLYAFLPYFRPLGDWTPTTDTSLAAVGYVLSPLSPLDSILHLQVLKTGRFLAGMSLNTIELSLLSHGLTIFTIWFFESGSITTSAFPEVFLLAFIWGLMLAVLPAITFIQDNIKLAKMKPQCRPKNAMKQRYKFAFYTYITIAIVILTLVRSWLIEQLGQEPFYFVSLYLLNSPECIWIVLYWAVVAGLGVIVVIYFWGSKPVGGITGFPYSALRLLKHSTAEDLHQIYHEDDVFFEEEDTSARRARALDRRRKFFHGLVVVMFLPTINRDPQLSYLALSLAFTAFIFEELVRATALPPFGLAIHKFLSGFTDHRDKSGHLVVSHLFLLIGVAAPVWLTLTGEFSSNDHGSDANLRNSIAMLSGVLTLGAGDAAASIIGKKYGRHRWPALRKTIEGTIAFILAMMLGALTTMVFSNDSAKMHWTRFFFSVVATGLLEAVSTQNDNLVIPVFMWCLIYRS